MINALSDTKIRRTKPKDRPLKLSDGGGLYRLVNPTGSRWWRFKYRFGGKERGISLGGYPTVTLKDARDRREDARRLVSEGIDPSANRKPPRSLRPRPSRRSQRSGSRYRVES